MKNDTMKRYALFLLVWAVCLCSFGERVKIVGKAGDKAVKAYLKKIPQAADIVFRCGAPIVMCGLDVTTQAYFEMDDLDEMADTGSKAGTVRTFKRTFPIIQHFTVPFDRGWRTRHAKIRFSGQMSKKSEPGR